MPNDQMLYAALIFPNKNSSAKCREQKHQVKYKSTKEKTFSSNKAHGKLRT